MSRRTRRRRKRVANQAAAIVALVWDEIDPEEIRRVIDGLQIDRAHAETFKTAMMVHAVCLPMPWYRLDIPRLLEAIGRYVAGQPWSVQAEEEATDQNREESSTTRKPPPMHRVNRPSLYPLRKKSPISWKCSAPTATPLRSLPHTPEFVESALNAAPK